MCSIGIHSTKPLQSRRDVNPGVGPRRPPGTPPHGGVCGWGIENSKPYGTGDFFGNPPGFLGFGFLGGL